MFWNWIFSPLTQGVFFLEKTFYCRFWQRIPPSPLSSLCYHSLSVEEILPTLITRTERPSLKEGVYFFRQSDIMTTKASHVSANIVPLSQHARIAPLQKGNFVAQLNRRSLVRSNCPYYCDTCFMVNEDTTFLDRQVTRAIPVSRSICRSQVTVSAMPSCWYRLCETIVADHLHLKCSSVQEGCNLRSTSSLLTERSLDHWGP